MSLTENNPLIDIGALKAQIDADIAAQILNEVDDGKHIYRRSFRIGELNLLVELDVTSEVAEMPTVCRLPGAPHGVKGLVNRHGRVIPVLDLALLFGFQVKPDVRPWLLVCGRAEAAVGLIIDNLPERKSFVPEDAINLAEVTSPMTPYARAAYQQDKDIWLDIDSEAFFAAVFKVEVVTA
jgi:chemotaxis signal transduction protein